MFSTLHAQCWWRPEEGNGPLGTGAMEDCEQPGRCGELNPGPLRGQEIFLITTLCLYSPQDYSRRHGLKLL